MAEDKRTPAGRIHRHRPPGRWSGVKTERYKPKGPRGGSWASIVRRVIVGNKGEAAKFHLRYFEIAPGGFSSLERHRHEHVVIAVRGSGKVRMGKKRYSLGFLDTIYIGPDTVHQLSNPPDADEPFGFFCIVDARRDTPKLVKPSPKRA